MNKPGSFLKVEGKNIVDQNGQKIRLRGVNFGGWLMMEGYILHGRNIPEHRLKQEFVRLNGEKELENFQRLYRENFITQADVRRIKKLGANCLRLPFNYRLLEDERGWFYLDQMIKWCGREGLWCILDLHAAPGAQNADWHSDSDGLARFWQEEKFRRQYLAIWRKIAQRYKEEAAIAGYDVLNEPVLNNPRLLTRFYHEVVREIRRVDRGHILFLEANLWGQQLKPMGRPWDKNIVYSIHVYQPLNFTFNFQPRLEYPGRINGRYWDKRRVEQMLIPYHELAEKWQAPIYVGEFGVNFRSLKAYGELDYLKDVLETFQKFGFHWTYWTFKAAANEVYPDGIYQYLPNSPWIKREGPTLGWENFPSLWKTQKRQIVSSWRTERFSENRPLTSLLSRYF